MSVNIIVGKCGNIAINIPRVHYNKISNVRVLFKYSQDYFMDEVQFI
jgi:hypothetical protein